MRAAELELIQHLPLFADISCEQVHQLLATDLLTASARATFPVNSLLFEQGDTPSALHILIQGVVELFAISADGKETAMEILGPTDNFILAAVLLDTPYLMGAKVLKTATTLMIPARVLRAEIVRRPKLALAMLASMAGQYRTMVKQLKDMKLRSGTQRLVAQLLRLHRQGGASGDRVMLPVSKQVLAGRLGMTPENLSRSFATLRDYGVTVRRDAILLTDIARLEAYCLPDALIDGDERC